MSNISGVTKYFPTVNEGFTTTLNGSVSVNAAILPLNSVSGLTDGSVFVGIIEPGDATKQQVFTGTVDVAGSRLTGCVYTRGTSASGHAGGVTVVDYVTGTAMNMISKGVLTQHNQDGTHGAVTATSVNTTGAVTAGNGLTVAAGSITAPVGAQSARTLTNPYKFSAYKSSTTTLLGNTWTKATLNTEFFDTGSNFDSTTNFRFTAPVNGFYQINAQIGIGSAGISNTVGATAAIYKNGVQTYSSAQQIGSGAPTALPRFGFGILLQLSAGDYLELWGWCGEGRDIVGGSDITYMMGYLVSST